MYYLSFELGVLVSELEQCSATEIDHYFAYLKIKSDEEAKAHKKAGNKSQGKNVVRTIS